MYVRPNLAAVYLLINEGEAAIIDTGTQYSVPLIEQKMAEQKVSPEKLRYIIPTHAHLDHAGGAGLLSQKFPMAKIVAHPKAAVHLQNPFRLKQGTIAVYGEENFTKLYKEIIPIEEEKILVTRDGLGLPLGREQLIFFHREGHASHHVVVLAEDSSIVFSGDCFGIAYPELQKGDTCFIFPTSTPVDFDSQKAVDTVRFIVNLNTEKIALTHFGVFSQVATMGEILERDLLSFASIMKKHEKVEKEETLQKLMREEMKLFFHQKFEEHGMDLSLLPFIENDLELNAMGLVWANTRRKKKGL